MQGKSNDPPLAVLSMDTLYGMGKLMSETLHIENWHPISVNKLLAMHWAEAAKKKSADTQMIAAYAHKQKISKATKKRLVEVTITLAKGQRALDQDNYQKSLNDALVKCMLLVDDNRQWLEMAPIQFNRALHKAITIKFTDIEQLPTKYAMNSIIPQKVRPKQKGKGADA